MKINSQAIYILLIFTGFYLPVISDRATENRSDYLYLSDAHSVRVLLFDSAPPQHITLTAAGAPLFVSFDDDGIIMSANESIRVSSAGEKLMVRTNERVFATHSVHIANGDGLIRLESDTFPDRIYRGDFNIEPGNSSALRIINRVNLEDYIASVVGSEMNFNSIEALKAQAVVSRTYALWTLQSSPFDDFDLKDFEANQVYTGAIPLKPWYKDAAMATHGEILTWSNQLILTTFSSTCGGKTSSNHDVWNGRPLPYLQSVDDREMCSISPHYEWTFQFDRSELSDILQSRYGFRYHDVQLEKDSAGRVSTITFLNNSTQKLEFSGNEFRLLINNKYTPLSIRSTRFNWHEENGEVIIEGGGLGHGVGMCQWGAKGFAQNGWNYKEILAFYFSGVKVVDLHSIESDKIALHK